MNGLGAGGALTRLALLKGAGCVGAGWDRPPCQEQHGAGGGRAWETCLREGPRRWLGDLGQASEAKERGRRGEAFSVGEAS